MGELPFTEEYAYGFSTDTEYTQDIGKGLSEEVVRKISAIKNEPEWMTNYRVDAYHRFANRENQTWGPDLSGIDFDEITYYRSAADRPVRDWEDVPEEIKETFERLGVPESERKFLAGASAQFESEIVYQNMQEDLEKQGVIFTTPDEALQNHPEIFKKYFGKLVPLGDNRYADLNSAVWSGGTFIYVPPNVQVEVPLQAYFRMNDPAMGQFERTMIIVDDGATLNYVEGCTAPVWSVDSLHAAIVEIYVGKNATCRYTTIQNWSNNVYNLVTQRAQVEENGSMDWIDGNLGSKVNMKYPATILAGRGARGTNMNIALAVDGQIQDTGAKMIHKAPNTFSSVVSKTIGKGTGEVNYRGDVVFTEESAGSKAVIECDTIIFDEESVTDTFPYNEIRNNDVILEHEARVSKISEEQLFYLMSRGIDELKAMEMIIMGFVEPFTRELPMEYAVELNRLISWEMEGSLG